MVITQFSMTYNSMQNLVEVSANFYLREEEYDAVNMQNLLGRNIEIERLKKALELSQLAEKHGISPIRLEEYITYGMIADKLIEE